MLISIPHLYSQPLAKILDKFDTDVAFRASARTKRGRRSEPLPANRKLVNTRKRGGQPWVNGYSSQGVCIGVSWRTAPPSPSSSPPPCTPPRPQIWSVHQVILRNSLFGCASLPSFSYEVRKPAASHPCLEFRPAAVELLRAAKGSSRWRLFVRMTSSLPC